jgi:hypothetical protein
MPTSPSVHSFIDHGTRLQSASRCYELLKTGVRLRPEQGVKVLGLLLAGSTGQQEQVEMGWPNIHG